MLSFAKYHALGNDFVVVDRLDGGEALTKEQAVWLCNRHLGIGADGVLTLWPDAECAGRMQLHNADGSESAMCANGLRCLAHYLYDVKRAATDHPEVAIRAGSGIYHCERISPDRFRVRMGRPVWSHPDLPPAEPDGTVTLAVGERVFSAVVVHLGNPHAVIFLGDEKAALLAGNYGATLEHHGAFPNRANIAFANQTINGFSAVIHERGVGITLACGSGATATAAAAVRRGLWPRDREMEIQVPGGALTAFCTAEDELYLTGSAELAFSGEVAWP